MITPKELAEIRAKAGVSVLYGVTTVIRLLDEIDRLNAALQWEQHRTGRGNGTTHAEGCHTWGPKHYECLLAEHEAETGEIERLREALKPFAEESRGWDFPEEYDDMQNISVDCTLTVGDLRRARAALGASPLSGEKK